MEKLRALSADQPPRVLIYGPPKIGKTTLASEFPNPVWIQIEDGQNSGSVLTGWGRNEISSFGDVISAMQSLYDEEHDFQTLVVDSMSEMQAMIFAETCARGDEKGNAKNRIEDFGYGKGYVNALNVFDEFFDGLNALRSRGMAIVLIAHARIERFDDPETASYDRYEIDLYEGNKVSFRKPIEREMDAILLLKTEASVKKEEIGFNQTRGQAEGGATRFIYCQAKPAFVAGSRYGMPPKIVYRQGEGYAALAKFFPAPAASAARAA